MSELFQTEASVEKVEKRKDGSLKLVVETQELDAEDTTKLFQFWGKLGWFLFKEAPMAEADLDLPEEIKEFKDDKSPSQRLRSVLYVYWDKCTIKKVPFNRFYEAQYDKWIEEIKDKLPND